MPAPAAMSESKREAILDGAGRIFAEFGYEGAGMAAITKAAGVSKGTIYSHFPRGKAELFGAVIERECARNLAPLFSTPAIEQDPEATLRDLGARFIRLLTSPTGLAVDRVVMSEAARFPELAQAFYEAGPARAIAALTAWMRAQAEAGRLRIPDPEFAAEQFFALCQHPAILRRRLNLTPSVPEEEINRIADAAVDMFLRAHAIARDRASP